MDIAKTIRVNRLIDMYGSLLTDKQLSVVTEYFCYNNSLSEISENLGISRQAVNYTIKQALSALETYESKLNMLYKVDRVKDVLQGNNLSVVLDILED